MASTIKLKNGSGAPLASDLVQGEPALDLTNKRLYTEDSGGTVIEVGTNPTELQVDNINIDGNAITSTDTNGDITITPNGTGTVVIDTDLDVDNININGNAITSTDTDGNITITPNGTGEVDISKVDIDGGTIDGTVIGGTTTAAGSFTTLQADTSLNVDGTVTADGLTVDKTSGTDHIEVTNGTAGSDASPQFMDLTFTGFSNRDMARVRGVNRNSSRQGGSLQFETSNANSTDASTYKKRMFIDTNGDISFYEDTGTTAKFFWDASAESLGIGTTSPANRLEVVDSSLSVNSGVLIQAVTTDATNKFAQIKSPHYTNSEQPVTLALCQNTSTANSIRIGGSYSQENAATDIGFYTAANNTTVSGTERMRIDSSGNLDMTNGGGDIIMANGAGIDFSASEGSGADGSGGSVLDDYEEGTWTPASAQITVGSSSGSYTKVGRMVYVSGTLPKSAASTTSNSIEVTGLPFSESSSFTVVCSAFWLDNGSPALGDIVGAAYVASSSLFFVRPTDASQQTTSRYVRDSDLNNGRSIAFSAWYETSA